MADAAAWLKAYDETRKQSEMLIELVRTKNSASNPQEESKLKLQLRTQSRPMDGKIKMLMTDLQKMRRNPVVYKLTRMEIQDRVGMMDVLKKQRELILLSLNPKQSAGPAQTNSNPLFQYKESEATQGNSNRELMDLQREIMEVQHGRKLDTISKHMTDLKEIGVTIGDELDAGDDIIEALDANMDVATKRVKETAKKVAKTRKKVRVSWKLICLNGCTFVCLLIFLVLAFIKQSGLQHSAPAAPDR